MWAGFPAPACLARFPRPARSPSGTVPPGPRGPLAVLLAAAAPGFGTVAARAAASSSGLRSKESTWSGTRKLSAVAAM